MERTVSMRNPIGRPESSENAENDAFSDAHRKALHELLKKDGGFFSEQPGLLLIADLLHVESEVLREITKNLNNEELAMVIMITQLHLMRNNEGYGIHPSGKIEALLTNYALVLSNPKLLNSRWTEELKRVPKTLFNSHGLRTYIKMVLEKTSEISDEETQSSIQNRLEYVLEILYEDETQHVQDLDVSDVLEADTITETSSASALAVATETSTDKRKIRIPPTEVPPNEVSWLLDFLRESAQNILER